MKRTSGIMALTLLLAACSGNGTGTEQSDTMSKDTAQSKPTHQEVTPMESAQPLPSDTQHVQPPLKEEGSERQGPKKGAGG